MAPMDLAPAGTRKLADGCSYVHHTVARVSGVVAFYTGLSVHASMVMQPNSHVHSTRERLDGFSQTKSWLNTPNTKLKGTAAQPKADPNLGLLGMPADGERRRLMSSPCPPLAG
jgi:hypothetical protein